MRAVKLLFVSLVAFGCSGAEKQVETAPLPPAVTQATLAGHRCASGDFCACRAPDGADDAEKAPPAEGLKRFEVRVASSDGQAWVTIDGRERLYKSPERAEDCYYLDLAPGDHTVSLRAKSQTEAGGVGAALSVSEYNAKNGLWYDAFRFGCGAPGACAKEQIEDWKAAVEKDRTKMWDPCSATKIRSLAWETGRMPDALHPEEIKVTFTLKIATNPPSRPPRDPECPLN
jgi:hypothetical protein